MRPRDPSLGRSAARRRVFAGVVASGLGVASALGLACGPGGRDVAVAAPGGDGDGGAVATEPRGANEAGATEAYEHVAKRPHVVLALAEARGLPSADARALVESLADAFEGCAATEAGRGALVDGAARLVLVGARGGGVGGHKLVVAPGAEVAANALVCLVAPARALPLPRATAQALARGRVDVGLALEASWSARAAQ